MANNFLIAGSSFTSKAGSDSNAGTTGNNPKGTINGAIALNIAGILAVGTGSYTESVSGTIASSIVADGIVKVYGSTTMVWNVNGPGNAIVSGIFFTGLLSVTGNVRYEDCIFENISGFAAAGALGTFVRCKFINCTWTGTNVSRYSFDYCIFINCVIRDCFKMTNSYINGVTTLRTIAAITAANFDANNLMGTIAVGTTTYQNLAAHKVSFSTLNVTSFNLAPKFTNIEKLDFTLQFDSPHIRVDTTNLGATQTGVPTTIFSPEFLPENGAIWTGIMVSGTDAVLMPGYTVGTIRAKPIRSSVNSAEISNILYQGLLAFNKSTAGSSSTNKNVPDSAVYAASDVQALSNPDRLTAEFRWTLNENEPVFDTDYTNGNLIPTGTFAPFCLNRKPTVDNNGKANGAAGFNPALVNPVSWIWYQPQITLRDNYL